MRAAAIAFAVVALALTAGAGTASAAFVTGFDDNQQYLSPDDATRTDAFDATTDLDAGIVRLDLVWSQVVSGQPANPADPADSAYDFSAYDAAVREAAARGLRVMFTFYSAPGFAEGPGRPANTQYPNTWKPDPAALGAFATAVAARYSGGYAGLPAVHYFEAWNEPNLSLFLSPQYESGALTSADHYRRMLNAVATSVRAVDPQNRVIAGSTAPYGDDPGGYRTRPLIFLRDLLCLNGHLRRAPCPERPDFDILGHHPINLSGPPTQSAVDPDDASSADLGEVVDTLRAAERAGTVAGGRHPVWATEFWWPIGNDTFGTSAPNAKVQGLWVEQSLYLFWRAGAKAAINFLLGDKPSFHTGVLTPSGQRKPSFTAMQFPFVIGGRSARTALAWGRAPVTGRLTIQARRGGAWRAIERLHVRGGSVFTHRLSGSPRGKYRARVKGMTSLVWRGRPIKPTS